MVSGAEAVKLMVCSGARRPETAQMSCFSFIITDLVSRVTICCCDNISFCVWEQFTNALHQTAFKCLAAFTGYMMEIVEQRNGKVRPAFMVCKRKIWFCERSTWHRLCLQINRRFFSLTVEKPNVLFHVTAQGWHLLPVSPYIRYPCSQNISSTCAHCDLTWNLLPLFSIPLNSHQSDLLIIQERLSFKNWNMVKGVSAVHCWTLCCFLNPETLLA